MNWNLIIVAEVTITLYTYLGNVIKRVIIPSGVRGGQGGYLGQTNQVTWDGRDGRGVLQGTGGYICQVRAKSGSSSRQQKVTTKIGVIR